MSKYTIGTMLYDKHSKTLGQIVQLKLDYFLEEFRYEVYWFSNMQRLTTDNEEYIKTLREQYLMLKYSMERAKKKS
jgi:hypothetical protein